MDKKSTTFGLGSEKLARLLNIGSDISETGDDVDHEEKKAELFHDWLAATLPLDAVFLETSPTILQHLYRQLQPHIGKSFANLLQDPQTNILIIKKIKDYSKKLVSSSKSKVEHDAATAVYFAAIASALLFHDRKITTFSYKTLDESYSKLINEKWISKSIVELFSKAREICQQKSRRK